jgi:hypothetical protein
MAPKQEYSSRFGTTPLQKIQQTESLVSRPRPGDSSSRVLYHTNRYPAPITGRLFSPPPPQVLSSAFSPWSVPFARSVDLVLGQPIVGVVVDPASLHLATQGVHDRGRHKHMWRESGICGHASNELIKNQICMGGGIAWVGGGGRATAQIE